MHDQEVEGTADRVDILKFVQSVQYVQVTDDWQDSLTQLDATCITFTR